MPKWPPSSHTRSSSHLEAEAGSIRGRLAARVLIAGIRMYRLVLSPVLPAACRFAPTCSTFAQEAIQRHGAVRGLRLAAARVARCHPWHPGGFDPVPGVEG